MYGGDFLEYSKGEIVIKGKVLSYGRKLNDKSDTHSNMRVEVIEVISGAFSHGVLTLVGDRGYDCRAYIDTRKYELGSTHLFVLFEKTKKQGLAGCGEVSVSVRDRVVTGVSRGTYDRERKAYQFEPYTYEYDDFVSQLRAQ